MPKSASFTLILRRSAARIVSCVMGSSYVLPVRLSVTVSVSRDLADASAFCVSVADVEESIAVLERQSRREPCCSATVHQSADQRECPEVQGLGAMQASHRKNI